MLVGTHHVSTLSARIGETKRVDGVAALEYWAARLAEHEFPHGSIIVRDGRHALDFDDPVGTQLSLVVDGSAGSAGSAAPWSESPVPAAFQLRGLGYTMLTVPVLEPTRRFLTVGLGFVHDHAYTLSDAYGAEQSNVHVFRVGAGGVHAEVHCDRASGSAAGAVWIGWRASRRAPRA